MKVYISADMEGITGVTTWDEVEKNHQSYEKFALQMTKEVASACNGALKAGAKEIWVKDAHDTGRNIDPSLLPKEVKLIRGWSGHPFSMVQGLDDTFDALIFIGYHAPSGSGGNPLAHTMNSTKINYLKINGRYASEFLIHAYAAASVNVPVIFLSGDKALCEEVREINNNIRTLATKEGKGNSCININPNLALTLIEEEVERGLRDDLDKCLVELPKYFNVEVSFREQGVAYKSSFYPGMELLSPHTLSMETENYFEVLTMINFLI